MLLREQTHWDAHALFKINISGTLPTGVIRFDIPNALETSTGINKMSKVEPRASRYLLLE